MTASWKRVLEGRTAERAIGAVKAILLDLTSQVGGRAPNAFTREDPFVALLFAEAARSMKEPSMAAAAQAVLDDAILGMAQRPMAPALFGGFSGVAWLAMRLPNVLAMDGRSVLREPALDHSSDDHCEEIDEALLEVLRRSKYPGYDLVSGLVGIGVYALERLSQPSGRELLELVITVLARTSVERNSGITWHTRPEALPEQQRLLAPDGYYNLGVAHGVPGIVAVLGHAIGAGVAVKECSALLDGAVAWLLSEQRPQGDGARYPGWIAPGVEPIPGRAAWCYGGLGVSAALMTAARSVGNEYWEREARRLALMEARRANEAAGVVDACLCHGAAGNAHIFRRFYEATAEGEYLAAALRWYNRTLDLQLSGKGIGGYVFWGSLDRSKLTVANAWIVEPSFVSGSAGVGLALLAATHDHEPWWDRLLLCDIPSRQLAEAKSTSGSC